MCFVVFNFQPSLTEESNLLRQHESGLTSSSYELSQYMTDASELYDPMAAAGWSTVQAGGYWSDRSRDASSVQSHEGHGSHPGRASSGLCGRCTLPWGSWGSLSSSWTERKNKKLLSVDQENAERAELGLTPGGWPGNRRVTKKASRRLANGWEQRCPENGK